MPYTWTYAKHGTDVYYVPPKAAVSGAPTTVERRGVYVASAVNGLVAQSICNQLDASDPTGSLLHRQSDCATWRNAVTPSHEGRCEFISQPITNQD